MEQNQRRQALEGVPSPETKPDLSRPILQKLSPFDGSFETLLNRLSQPPSSPQKRHLKEDSNDLPESPLEVKPERKKSRSDPRKGSETHAVLDIFKCFADFSPANSFLKKSLNVDSPSFQPATLSVPGKPSAISSQAVNAAPFTPRALASGTHQPQDLLS